MRLAVTVPSKHIERDMVFRPLAALLLAALTITPASAAWSQNQTEDAILPPAAIGGAQGEIIVAQESSLADMLARVQRLDHPPQLHQSPRGKSRRSSFDLHIGRHVLWHQRRDS